MAALGNLALKVLGMVGGLLAIAIGLIWLGFGFIASTSSHVGSAGGMLAMAGGVVLMLIGLAAIYSSIIYTKKPRPASKLLLASGVLGFPVSYAADCLIMGGIWGLLAWIIPGTLIIAAGLIGWIIARGLTSALPMLSDDRAEVRLGGRVLYGALAVVGIVLLMGILLLCVAMFFSMGEQLKSDDDFSDALLPESMGRYDIAISEWDRIIARNQSNAEAWMRRGYALEKLGRHNEAEQSYQRARQLESANSTAQRT